MIENSNPNSVRVTEAEAADQLARMRQERALNKPNDSRVVVRVGGDGGSNTGGIVETRNKYAQVTTTNPDPRIVLINGMETSKENYEFLKASNQLPPGAKIHFPFQNPASKP